MWIRMRFDISWRDVLCAMAMRCGADGYESAVSETLAIWNAGEQWMPTFSVRSAFDLALRALDLAPGSEVLMSPITVPDMVRIVRAHRLVPVPVDLLPDQQLSLESLEANLSPRSRVMVAAHLFGGRLNLDLVAERLKRAGVLLFEDCAQSFIAKGEPGHPSSDLVMISFGPIKTATAFGGAMVRVADAKLRYRMQEILNEDPLQASSKWQKRLLKFALLKMFSGNRMAAALHAAIRMSGRDCDLVINELGKGFKARDIISQIRQRPHPGLLKLLSHRWRHYNATRIERRRWLGQRMDEWLHQTHQTDHSYWTYPLAASDPQGMSRRLREHGFDATNQTRLAIVEAESACQRPQLASAMLRSYCFLPWYPELTDQAAERMADLAKQS